MAIELTTNETGTPIKVVRSRPAPSERSESKNIDGDLAKVVITDAEMASSSAARDVARWQRDGAYRKRRPRAAVTGSLARLLKERERLQTQKVHGDETRERVANTPRKVRPRPPIHFSEIGGVLQIADNGPIEDLLNSIYWANSVHPLGGSATLSAGRRANIVTYPEGKPRNILLEFGEVSLGGATDQNRINVKLIEQ